MMRPLGAVMEPGVPRNQRGFTLLEVMLALSILATILVILFSTYSAAVERAERIRERSQIYHEARVLLELMANDLRGAYVEAAQAPQPGFQPAKVRTYTFVGEDLEEARLPADKLIFYAFLPLLRSDLPQPEVCRVTYSLETMADPAQGKILFRRVHCSLDPETTEQEYLFPLTELAQGLDFRYYDAKGNEQLAWDSRDAQGGRRLPALVKIMVLLADQQGLLRPFEMSTELMFDR